MGSVRLREARDDAAQFALSQPFGQPLTQHASTRTADASHNDDCPIAPLSRGLQKANERRAGGFLCVAVQIERRANLELAAANAFLRTTISGRRCRSRPHWR